MNIHATKEQLIRLKNIVYLISCTSITIGILALFVASLFTDNVGISNMNNFVGISLGIVATTTSLISMFLSFYNLEKSEASEAEQKEALRNMTEIQKEMKNTLINIDAKTEYILKRKPSNIMTENLIWTNRNREE